jgi:hypothetical protein
MNYDRRVTFVQTNQEDISEKPYNANITQMGPDEALSLFGNAKQRPFVIRLPVSIAVRTGFVKTDDLVLQIDKVVQLRQRTTIYGVEYHGRL